MKFYKNVYPNIDDIVICKINRIDNELIYVNLLEYNNIEGIVELKNASTRRKKKVKCTLKINRKYPLLVINIDKEKCYIDLSNKYLSDEDKDNSLKKYNNYFLVLKIFKNFMKLINKNYTEDDYINYANKTIWNINKNKCYDYLLENYYAHTKFNSFNLNESENILLNDSLKNIIGEFNIESKLIFTLINPNYGGVLTIKKIFDNIHNYYNDSNISLVTTPEYEIKLISKNKKININNLIEIEKKLIQLSETNKLIFNKKNIISKIV